MYSLEQRTDAIQLFIESGFNENAVIRSLGYPSPTMTIDCLDRDTIRRYRQRMDNPSSTAADRIPHSVLCKPSTDFSDRFPLPSRRGVCRISS